MEEGTVPTSRFGVLLGNRNFRAVYLAGVTSQSGSTIAGVAIIWIVFATTRSALDIAYVGIAELAATIAFTLPSGVWVDRYDRTRLMVGADLTRAVAVGSLALVFLLYGFRFPLVLVVSFAVAAASILFQPAEQTLFPMIVAPGALADANGLSRSSRSMVQLVASSVGGGLVVLVGAALCLFYNTLTFLISALLLYSVYVALRAADRGRPPHPAREGRMLHEIREGLHWLIHKAPGLWELSISALFLNFFSTIFATFIVVYVVEVLHGTPLTYGLFLATMTGGMAVGSLIVGRTRATRWAGKVWVLSYGVGAGLALLTMALVPGLLVSFVLIFVYNVLLGFSGNAWLTAAQTVVPSEVQGRYFALDGILSWGILPIAQITGGLLIEARGIGFAVEVAGIGLLGSGFLSMLGRNLWKFGTPA